MQYPSAVPWSQSPRRALRRQPENRPPLFGNRPIKPFPAFHLHRSRRGWTFSLGRMTTGTLTRLALTLCGLCAVAVLAATAVYHRDRRHAETCVEHLVYLDAVKRQWAFEEQHDSSATPTLADLSRYMRSRSPPRCPAGGTYTTGPVSDVSTCSIPGHDSSLVRSFTVGLTVAGQPVPQWADRSGVTVVVRDSTGRRVSGVTDEQGVVKISTWPHRPISFEASSPGYGSVIKEFSSDADSCVEVTLNRPVSIECLRVGWPLADIIRTLGEPDEVRVVVRDHESKAHWVSLRDSRTATLYADRKRLAYRLGPRNRRFISPPEEGPYRTLLIMCDQNDQVTRWEWSD